MTQVTPPAGTPAAATATQQDARARKAAQDFEALALGELLAPMFATLDADGGAMGGGAGEAAWRPMLVQEMAKRIAARGGLGLSEPIYRQILAAQEKK